MKRDSHSWSWSVCMSITAAMTWVVPLGGLTHLQRTASAISIPEDEATPRVTDQIRSSEWFTEVGQPMMEMLGIPENDWIRFLTESSIESDAHESLPGYGEVYFGFWADTPILFSVCGSTDFTESLEDIAENHPDTELREGVEQFLLLGLNATRISGVVTNLRTGRAVGVDLGRWELPYPYEIVHPYLGTPAFSFPIRKWFPEDPSVAPNLGPLFGGSFFDFVDTSTTDDGIKRWYHRARQIGPDAPLCAACNNGTTNTFCPALYMNDTSTCLGKGLRDFRTCQDNADASLRNCLAFSGAGTIGVGIVGAAGIAMIAAAIAKCSATGVGIAVCLALLGITTGVILFLCYGKYNARMQECFNALSDKFEGQMTAACNGEECPG